jgi:hypothetical protein
MTEEEKMDKKQRAVAKKSADGAPMPKAKPPAKNDGPNAAPAAGTLQSYMARRKQQLSRKRRQNQPSATAVGPADDDEQVSIQWSVYIHEQ